MKPIKQKHETGCGVAAVAMVAGVPYNRALKAVHPNHARKKKFFVSWVQLREALLRLNVRYGDFRRMKASATDVAVAAKLTKKACIIGVAEKTRVKKWHYLVVSKTGKVYDPYYGKAIDPASYPVVRSILEVTPS